jgi:hypothetical protein
MTIGRIKSGARRLDAKADPSSAWVSAQLGRSQRLAAEETPHDATSEGTAFALRHRGEWEPLLEERSLRPTARRGAPVLRRGARQRCGAMSRSFQYETNAHNAQIFQPHGDEAVY